jgi:hypothetical protein
LEWSESAAAFLSRRSASAQDLKHTMLVQSTVALALFGLIVARAVNAF